MRPMIVAMVGAVALLAPGRRLPAQGHGPVYGLSTPTLGQGGWSLDVGGMGRFADGRRTVMIRPMVSYGVTEDVQASLSVPVQVVRDPWVPPMRSAVRMPATRDVEAGVGWRFQRRAVGVGARQETTLWVALDQPLDGRRAGVSTSPALFGGLVTGYASRTVYVWAGGAYRRPMGSGEDRRGDLGMGSLVVGYRPSRFREDYPHPDWRVFAEVVGEWRGADRVGGEERAGSGGGQVFLAFTALGLYGWWGIAGGPAFPVARDLHGDRPDDTLRFVANVTFWW